MEKILVADPMVDALVSVLGIKWHVDSDFISIASAEMHVPTVQSKRQVVSQICSIFDPLGLFCPITIRVLMLMQDIWRSAIGWTDNLPENLRQQWGEMVKDLSQILTIQGPRNPFTGNGPSLGHQTKYELHCFYFLFS